MGFLDRVKKFVKGLSKPVSGLVLVSDVRDIENTLERIVDEIEEED